MRLACHDYNWIPYAHQHGETLELERVLAEVVEAGYEGVEFSRHPMELDDPARSRRLLEKSGLTLTGLSLFYKNEPGLFETVKQNTRLLAEMGGKLAVFFARVDWDAPMPDDMPYRSTVELADGLAAFAATLGLDTVFHNHLGTSLETPDPRTASASTSGTGTSPGDCRNTVVVGGNSVCPSGNGASTNWQASQKARFRKRLPR